jgi:hypothetical protein
MSGFLQSPDGFVPASSGTRSAIERWAMDGCMPMLSCCARPLPLKPVSHQEALGQRAVQVDACTDRSQKHLKPGGQSIHLCPAAVPGGPHPAGPACQPPNSNSKGCKDRRTIAKATKDTCSLSVRVRTFACRPYWWTVHDQPLAAKQQAYMELLLPV